MTPPTNAAKFVEHMREFTDPLPIVCVFIAHHWMLEAVVLTDLFADVPGKGIGSRVMVEAIRSTRKFGGLWMFTDAACVRSCEFYLRHGFQRAQRGTGHQLVRFPGTRMRKTKG